MKKTILAAVLGCVFVSAQAQNTETLAQRQLVQGGAAAAQARNVTGFGVRIGIIDQGFDLTHSDFSNRILVAQNFYNYRTVTWGAHGTAMTGVAAAGKNNSGAVGVAPESFLLLAQVGSGGTSMTISESAVFRALDWLSINKAAVINLSFGAAYTQDFVTSTVRNTVTGTYFSSSKYGVNYGANNSVLPNYKLATDRGSILVVAAGNQGLAYSEFPGMYATRTDANGKLVLGGKMIVVGAVDTNSVMASFSNRAGHICQNAVALTCRDPYLTRDFFVVAPGTNIVATQANATSGNKNTAQAISGTSPAAAYVTGGIALMRQTWPQLRSEQLVSLVLNTTKDLGAPGTDNVYGRGLVDFDRATRPQGTLVVASANRNLGQGTVSGSALSTTMVAGGISSGLRTSTVLAKAQVIDEIDRNYNADLTKAIVGKRFVYDPVSPYLAYTGYYPLTVKTQSGELTVLSGINGTAVNIMHDFGVTRLNYQLGTQIESRGFIGNYGTGAFDLGTSETQWHIFGVDAKLFESAILSANYGFGRSQVTNVPDSILHITRPVYTDTWKLGLSFLGIAGTDSQIGFGLAGDVRIRSGQARVSAVTGYEFIESDQGTVIGHPTVSSELVNLRQPSNSLFWMDYRVNINKSSKFTATVAGNQLGYRAGINLTWIQ